MLAWFCKFLAPLLPTCFDFTTFFDLEHKQRIIKLLSFARLIAHLILKVGDRPLALVIGINNFDPLLHVEVNIDLWRTQRCRLFV